MFTIPQLMFALAVMVASYFISASLMPKPEIQKPASFDDFDFPQFEEGTPQIVMFGDGWISDWAVLSYGDYRTETIYSKSGGKK